MGNLIMKILLSMLFKLLTESFIKRVILIGLRKLSEATENQTDDEIYQAVKEALDRPAKGEGA